MASRFSRRYINRNFNMQGFSPGMVPWSDYRKTKDFIEVSDHISECSRDQEDMMQLLYSAGWTFNQVAQEMNFRDLFNPKTNRPWNSSAAKSVILKRLDTQVVC